MRAISPLVLVALLATGPGFAQDAPLLAALGPDHAWLDDMPPALRDDLEERGLALAPGEEDGSGRVTGFAAFEAPVDLAYLLLSQTDRQTEYRDELKDVRRIAADGTMVRDEHRIRVMFISLRYTLEYRLDPLAHRIRWGLADDVDQQIEHIAGSWELVPLGPSRSLGRFETSVRVGKALPVSLQNMVTRRKVPSTLEATLEWVNREAVPLLRARSAALRSAGP